MSNTLHVWPEAPAESGDHVVRSAILETNDGLWERLWYRVPSRWAASLTEQADPFAVACNAFAMRLGCDLHVHGVVSPSLLANLEEYQAVWECWKPQTYQRRTLIADEEREATPAPGNLTIACFSGGVDACCTAYSHVNRLNGRLNRDIRAGLHVVRAEHLPENLGGSSDATLTSEADNASRTAENAELLLADLGVPLIRVVTNWTILRKQLDVDWMETFASHFAACMTLFQKEYSVGMLASGDKYYFVRPHGSTPLTDPMLSSQGFRIVNDGGNLSRIDKIRVVSKWPKAKELLRVCWAGSHEDRNCCRCEKCIRTILDFRVVGEPLPPCFAEDVTDDQIRSTRFKTESQRADFRSVLEYARSHGKQSESWVRAVEDCLEADRRRQEPPRPSLRARIRVRTRIRNLIAHSTNHASGSNA